MGEVVHGLEMLVMVVHMAEVVEELAEELELGLAMEQMLVVQLLKMV